MDGVAGDMMLVMRLGSIWLLFTLSAKGTRLGGKEVIVSRSACAMRLSDCLTPSSEPDDVLTPEEMREM